MRSTVQQQSLTFYETTVPTRIFNFHLHSSCTTPIHSKPNFKFVILYHPTSTPFTCAGRLGCSATSVNLAPLQSKSPSAAHYLGCQWVLLPPETQVNASTKGRRAPQHRAQPRPSRTSSPLKIQVKYLCGAPTETCIPPASQARHKRPLAPTKNSSKIPFARCVSRRAPL